MLLKLNALLSKTFTGENGKGLLLPLKQIRKHSLIWHTAEQQLVETRKDHPSTPAVRFINPSTLKAHTHPFCVLVVKISLVFFLEKREADKHLHPFFRFCTSALLAHYDATDKSFRKMMLV